MDLRSAKLSTTIFATVLAISALIFLPLVLTQLGLSDATWSRLATIGQAYGSASVLLSILALVGVTWSLILQRKQANVAIEAEIRERHWTLLKMAMDDPNLLECLEDHHLLVGLTPVEQRQAIFVNMTMNHWRIQWALGTISERTLRILAAGLLAGAPGRRFWTHARDYRLATHRDRDVAKFDEIIDQEFRRFVQG
jgi:Family of unknown function (DUF6082)